MLGSCRNSTNSKLSDDKNSSKHSIIEYMDEPAENFDELESSLHFDRAIHDITIVHSQLKKHSERLRTWEETLRKREWITDQILRDSDTRINAEVERRFTRGKEQFEKEIKLLESQIKDKSAEIQRLQNNFSNIRESYNKVKVERDGLKENCQELRKKNNSLESRLKNLKKITPKTETNSDHDCTKSLSTNDIAAKVVEERSKSSSASTKRKPAIQVKDIFNGPVASALKDLLIWVAEFQLEPLTYISCDKSAVEITSTLDQCLILLPKVTDLLHLHLNKGSALHLDDALFCQCLRFLHFSFLLIEKSEGTQKYKVAFSIHRLGEAISEFLLSIDGSQPETRRLNELVVCASMVVLHTVKQVDTVQNSWRMIKSLVITASGRQCFIKMKGHVLLLSLLNNQEYQFLTNQMGKVVDTLLCMFVEQDSDEANTVREMLKTQKFVKSFCTLLSNTAVSIAIKERLVVLFQQTIKRNVDGQLWKILCEYKVKNLLQKELSVCLSQGNEQTSYHFVLNATVTLLSSLSPKGKT